MAYSIQLTQGFSEQLEGSVNCIPRHWVDEASDTVHLISFRHKSRDYTAFMDQGIADKN